MFIRLPHCGIVLILSKVNDEKYISAQKLDFHFYMRYQNVVRPRWAIRNEGAFRQGKWWLMHVESSGQGEIQLIK